MYTPSAILKTHHLAMSETFCTLLTFSLQKSARIILHLLSTALVPLQNLYQTFLWIDMIHVMPSSLFIVIYHTLDTQAVKYSSQQVSTLTMCQWKLRAVVQILGKPFYLSFLMQSCCAAVTHMQIATNYNIYEFFAGLQSQKSQYCRSTYTR